MAVVVSQYRMPPPRVVDAHRSFEMRRLLQHFGSISIEFAIVSVR